MSTFTPEKIEALRWWLKWLAWGSEVPSDIHNDFLRLFDEYERLLSENKRLSERESAMLVQHEEYTRQVETVKNYTRVVQALHEAVEAALQDGYKIGLAMASGVVIMGAEKIGLSSFQPIADSMCAAFKARSTEPIPLSPCPECDAVCEWGFRPDAKVAVIRCSDMDCDYYRTGTDRLQLALRHNQPRVQAPTDE